ncbi:MAG: hypothetical protein U0694_06325 [Anaerolineae bacterium]
MLSVQVKNDALIFRVNFSVTFERTLRIPDDGKDLSAAAKSGGIPHLKSRGLRQNRARRMGEAGRRVHPDVPA